MSKKIMNIVLVVVALLFALTVAIYLFLSMKSDYVVAEVIKQVEEKSGAKFEFNEKPQVKIFPKLSIVLGATKWGKDNLAISFEKAQVQVDTLGLLFGKIDINSLEIENAVAYYKAQNVQAISLNQLAKAENHKDLVNQLVEQRAEMAVNVATTAESYFTEFKLNKLLIKNAEILYATDFEPEYALSILNLELKDFEFGNKSKLVAKTVISTPNGSYNYNINSDFILHKDFIDVKNVQAYVSSIGEKYFKSEFSMESQFTYNFASTAISVAQLKYGIAGLSITGAGTANIKDRKADLSINFSGNPMSLLQDLKINYIPKSPSALTNMTAKILLDMNDGGFVVSQSGNIDTTIFNSKSELTYNPLHIKTYVIIDEIELDAYIPVAPKSIANTNSSKEDAPAKAQSNESEILTHLNQNIGLDLGFKISKIKYKNTVMDSIDATFRGKSGVYNSTLSANIFDGQVLSSSYIDLYADKVQFTAQANSFEFASIAKSLFANDKFSGRLNANTDLNFKLSKPLATMSGEAKLLAQSLVINYNILPPEINFNTPKLNEFDSLNINADVLDGQVYLMPISLQSDQLQVNGKGQISLMDCNTDIRLKLTLPQLPEFPMKIVGTIPNLKYGVDQEELAKSTVQKMLDTGLDNLNKIVRDGQRKLNDSPSAKESVQSVQENIGKGLEELGAGLKDLIKRY